MTAKTRAEIITWLSAYLLHKHHIVWQGACTALADFGIDSLSSVDLVCALDGWIGMQVPNDFIAQVTDTDALIFAIEALQHTTNAHTTDSAYKTFVNPYLATKLAQLKIDRTFVRAEGCYLYDSEGERYLDFMAQYGALPLGHHPTEIWQAIDQLRANGEPIFAQPSIAQSAGKLAQRLIALAPAGLQHVTFSNSGTEAVEVALKIARQATGRLGCLSTRRGFHGKTLGALSATGNADYQTHFGLPLPDFDHIEYGDSAQLEQQLTLHPQRYAAFIVECIQGEGGMRVAPAGYLQRAKALCEQFGVLLIVDEVQTGLGRTGALFACEAADITPDILTLAKALGGGVVPIGATLCTAAVYTEKFALKHSSTFAGNALAACAGLSMLDVLTRQDGALLKHVQAQGVYLRSRLEEMQDRHPWLVEEIRGCGFMLGIQFTAARAPWRENFLGIAAAEQELAQFVASYLLNVERVRLAPTLNGGNVLRIQPPLNATHEQCVAAMDALARAVDVLASRQTGDFYRAILHRNRPTKTLQLITHEPPPQAICVPAAGTPRFAFLLHPLDERGYADYDRSLSVLQPDELREFSDSLEGLLDPVVGSSVLIESRTGARAQGDFILISHTAEQLKSMPQREALQVLNKGIDLAQQRGATLVGLGAYTSVVSGGGALLARPTVALTSGNSYTVVSGVEALNQALAYKGRKLQDSTVCVVGAAGAIGSCMATLLAECAKRMVLVGNPIHTAQIGRARLLATAQACVRHVLTLPVLQCVTAPVATLIHELNQMGFTEEAIIRTLESRGSLVLTQAIQTIAMADVVVTATSFPGELIHADMLRPGAIVCDLSRPRAISEAVAAQRTDVMVIDGGIIALPGDLRLGPYGIAPGTAYACMAETMLLALEGNCKDTSLGHAIHIHEVKRQQLLAHKHGFSVAQLQSFGHVVESHTTLSKTA